MVRKVSLWITGVMFALVSVISIILYIGSVAVGLIDGNTGNHFRRVAGDLFVDPLDSSLWVQSENDEDSYILKYDSLFESIGWLNGDLYILQNGSWFLMCCGDNMYVKCNDQVLTSRTALDSAVLDLQTPLVWDSRDLE